jgi:very-short-patch-repair endonuclease
MSRARARQLRKQSTGTERILWRQLRSRRLMNHKFRRQHTIEPYILDIYCPERRLAVELDGGGHNLMSERRYDAKRTEFLTNRGILVLRFWNRQVRENVTAVLHTIILALAAQVNKPIN